MATEDEMVGRHHQFNGHEFEQTLGDSGGQESLVWCSPWGRTELAMTERLNDNGLREHSACRTSPAAQTGLAFEAENFVDMHTLRWGQGRV